MQYSDFAFPQAKIYRNSLCTDTLLIHLIDTFYVFTISWFCLTQPVSYSISSDFDISEKIVISHDVKGFNFRVNNEGMPTCKIK
jgi:hypothetical protein